MVATVERSRAGVLRSVVWTGLCLACFIILKGLFFHKAREVAGRGETLARMAEEKEKGNKIAGWSQIVMKG